MEAIDELISKSNNNHFKILSIEYLKETQKIVLLKVKENLELFIDIIDIKNNLQKEIILLKKLFLDFSYTNNSKYFPEKNFNLNDREVLISIRHFHTINDENFILSNSKSNIKINIEGEVFYLPTFENIKYGEFSRLNDKHFLKNFIFRADMTLFDIDNCIEKELYTFINDNFDNIENYPSFTYLYFSEDRYTIFTYPNKNIVGFEIYDKDGDEPHFSYYILKVESLDNINIIFVGKSSNSGHYYVLSEDTNEIAYKRQHFDDPTNILIRELSDKFNDFEIHKVINNEEEIVYLNKNNIFLKKQNEIEILDRHTGKTNSVIIDKDSPFEIKENFLFFVKDSKLRFLHLNKNIC
jgi:hypothetical protein